MKGLIRLLILSALIASMTSCASRPADEDLSLESGAGDSSSEVTSAGGAETQDDFADFDEGKTADQAEQPKEESAHKNDQDLAIEDEMSQVEEGNQQAAAEPPAKPETPAQEPTPPAEVAIEEDPFAEPQKADIPAEPTPVPAPTVTETAPTQVPQVEIAPSPEVVSKHQVTNITDLKFRANDAGGTIVVKGDGPLTYTTRANPDLHQFIVEVENANLPERLKRSLNTKDIKGSVGAIDAYQSPGSTTARFVIQLREGVAEPAVQAEGNNLLIVANGTPSDTVAEAAPTQEGEMEASEVGSEQVGEAKILPGQNLTEFIAGNTKFYGKKISIETNNMDIRDALNFITEESGVNMVVAEEVKGTISLKLRQVPWDQALVVLMKAKKLGYTRQGNVLRIAPLQDLKAEEDDATKLALSRKVVEPLKVRMFPVSYAKVDELEKKIKDFLGDRGKVVGDMRTNSLVVTDIQENLDRVAKLITSLDTQPPQVLIEAKIVEAQESFSRNIGVSWSASGSPIKLGSTSRGPVNLKPSFGINPAANVPGNLSMNLAVGTLDVFGTLQAALALSESEGQVKILSAPRILTMSNEKADINQTTEVAVRSITRNGTDSTETFTFKPLTLKLDVTPQVTADGSVIMKVNVARQFPGADISSAGSGAFSVNSREANTRVLVKNGQTSVIGGIYQSDASEGGSGVPWLRDVPVLGYLFKTKNIKKDKSELLVFLTPRIIAPTDTSAATPATQDF